VRGLNSAQWKDWRSTCSFNCGDPSTTHYGKEQGEIYCQR